tara:strand:- start:130 stop:459 length:330 start_codon:yes stop_codon:yes gene_type:complete
MKNAVYNSANITNLTVEKLTVRDLKVEGNSNGYPQHHGSGEGTDTAFILAELIKEIALVKMEQEKINSKIDNLKIEDLKDVDTKEREEDGAFLGWSEENGKWMPFPEVG